ncbi:MAG: NAD(P)H-hydrate dehydratase [Thiohalocapsa sp.]|jgi:NAD(P)H-hydrate epimerase|uniref:NAD(P)H-hydrate dehydratase n=1 Tax=Thiohalocapsa sp. TaxID=2497641 RepID=UPI0025D47BE1|nr:NAD(P)H-hydrate dehydratase [Thiohalocapsa sp.]MCG6943242.1 NAD(P)H-hydrate dehydratase [Thiohalocapsa sp.]
MPERKPLPYALYRAAQVRALDRCAIERHGIPAAELMQRAGAAACRVLRARWPKARRVVVLAGAGNNGGDGYVLAAEALAAGLSVRLLQLGDHDKLSAESAEAATGFARQGGVAEPYQGVPADADVIVDGLLGTGLTREVTGRWAAAIDAINAARAPVLALDIPSGLDADTGRVHGTAVRADATISFIALKQGHFTGRGQAICGEIHFDGLDVPPAIYGTEVLSARRVDWHKERELLPDRPRDAHKGVAGRVLIVGGAPGTSGAPRLSGEAALRTGAGLVTVATHPTHASLLNLTRPELMVHGVDGPDQLRPLVSRVDAVAIGPGLGTDDWGRALLDAVLALDVPLVVDADGLNLLAQDAQSGSPRRRDDWILTPHPGEAARLLGSSIADVEQDRFAAVAALQQRYGGTALLKGAGTIVHGPARRPPAVCSDGTPAMASAGMGDTLTGILVALIGQGLEPEQAATTGVCLHAAAGVLAAGGADRGMLAGDLMSVLPLLYAERRQR